MSTDKFIVVFTGFEVNAQHLQNIFETAGIDAILRNDSESALRAGFGSPLPGQVRLLVPKSREEEAKKLIRETFPELYQEEE